MPSAATDPAPPSTRVVLHAALLALAVGLCYAGALSGPFLFDDPLPDVALGTRTRRLVWASFGLNRAISGADTWSYHLLNILVHLACALALLGVLRRALALAVPGWSAAARGRLALAVALLWAVHPLQTGVATYISQRAESMASLCYLGTLYGFLRALESRRPRAWMSLSLVSLALGFLCKEIIATAPLALLLAERTLAGRAHGGARSRWRFHGLVLLTAGALFWIFIAGRLLAQDASSGFGQHEAFGPLDYARTQPAVILHYLRLVFWPHPLVFDYDWPIASRPGDWVPQSLALVLLLGLTGFWILRRRPLGFAAGAFFLVLGPTSSIVPIRDVAFEHRMYLPLAAVLVVCAVGQRRLATRRPQRGTLGMTALTLVAVLALGAMTVRRNRDYASAIDLWSSVVRNAPENPRGHNNLAAALIDEERYREAEEALASTLALDPEWSSAHRNLGVIAAARGQIPAAITHLRRALELSDSAAVRSDLALIFRLTGRAAEEEIELRHALELDERRGADQLALARLLLSRPDASQERRAEALARAERATELLHSRRAEALGTQARAHLALGEPQQARHALEEALEMPALEPALATGLRALLSELPGNE